MVANDAWSEPDRCPFCTERLTSPGEGFVIHLDENAACKHRFETWRDRVRDDVRGGWTG